MASGSGSTAQLLMLLVMVAVGRLLVMLGFGVDAMAMRKARIGNNGNDHNARIGLIACCIVRMVQLRASRLMAGLLIMGKAAVPLGVKVVAEFAGVRGKAEGSGW